MKKTVFALLIVMVFISFAQEKPPNQYIQPEGKISLASTMPFFQAIQALSETSARIDKKIIIDTETRIQPINVEIVDKHWREALDLILKVNNLSMEEFPNYIRIIGGVIEGEERREAQKIHSGLREINIEAIFFEGDRHDLNDIGINWNWVVEKGSKAYTYYQNVIGLPSGDDRHSVKVQKIQEDGTVDEEAMPMMLIKALESKSIGDILANPNVTVMEGEAGRIQVGQDFTIKQLDFAGNVTDQILSSGIILNVTPTVVREDSITFIYLDLIAEKSSVTPGAISTIINKTNAQTKLTFLDGERKVIAGLYSTDESVQRSGVPVLKDLPWWFFGLKYIFGYNRTEIIEKELIVIIKAELVPTLKERTLSREKDWDIIRKKQEEIKNRWKK